MKSVFEVHNGGDDDDDDDDDDDVPTIRGLILFIECIYYSPLYYTPIQFW